MSYIISTNNAVVPADIDIINWTKSTILKYCPIVENRIDSAYGEKAPVLDIEISANKDKSTIRFLFGTSSYRKSTDDYVSIDRCISINEIERLINFILKDHEIISHFDIGVDSASLNSTLLSMWFDINWSDKFLKGLNCGKINLNIHFEDDKKIALKYMNALISKYRSKIEDTPEFKKAQEEYHQQEKINYFKGLNKEEMIDFIKDNISEDDLRDLLSNMDNDVLKRCVQKRKRN